LKQLDAKMKVPEAPSRLAAQIVLRRAGGTLK
jgi:hypothetical protein